MKENSFKGGNLATHTAIQQNLWNFLDHLFDTTMAVSEEYSQDGAIAEFFTQTSTTRSACDTKAVELTRGKVVVPVVVQGVCSYSVYAGPELEFVVQFRLKSLKLEPETANLARVIYGSLAPSVEFHGMLGEDDDKVDKKKEPLLVYVMTRMRGISHLDFVLASEYPNNSEERFVSRRNLMTDIARYTIFFVLLHWLT